MKRVILDTNIYGRIADEKHIEEMQKLADSRRDIIIYGFDVVRKELRDISSKAKREGKSLRLILLGIYDKLARTHIYYTTSQISQIAGEYYKIYRELGGIKPEKEILNDFLIVACASLHELDIVVSDDNKTMFSDTAVKTYRIVNSLRKYRLPEFIGYEKFRRSFSL